MPTMHTCGRRRRRQTRRDATHALPVTMHPHTAAAAHRRIIPIPAPCPIGDGPRQAGFGMVPTLRRRLPDGQPRDCPSSHALRGARGERERKNQHVLPPVRVDASSPRRRPSALGLIWPGSLTRAPNPEWQSRQALLASSRMQPTTPHLRQTRLTTPPLSIPSMGPS